MSTGKLQELSTRIVFLGLQSGGQKGFRRESRKPFAVNAGFLLFGWSASIPYGMFSAGSLVLVQAMF
jgi:hypothetical protein